jgi:lysine-ketoglutarate reductase/saccharopine dehydrogenase-like protein (TIGR00300 family)
MKDVVSEIIEARGHLIDSQILSRIFDKVIEYKAQFEVVDFQIGKTNQEFSTIKMNITAADHPTLQGLLNELVALSCYVVHDNDAALKSAEKDQCVPEDFYSTTNHKTMVKVEGTWLQVSNQRMDAVVVIEGQLAACRKLRDVRKGDLIVCGITGIRVLPEFKTRDRYDFAFMANDISSERRVEISVKKLATMIQDIKTRHGKIAVVAGPVVIHTGGADAFCKIIAAGYVDVLLSGNALAVHDIEHALFGTSLGIDLNTGVPVDEGHKNHMRAINTIYHCGSIRAAVEGNVLRSGVMYKCVKHDVPFVLAGSIRDDGPLPETIMDMIAAQEAYAQAIRDVEIVIMLSSMLHSIGVGNMLPSWVKTVCVDINPAVVTKLSDRGSAQAIGIVTDVGLFLELLARELSGFRIAD